MPAPSPKTFSLARRQFTQYLGASVVVAAANRLMPSWLTAQVTAPVAIATPFLDDLKFTPVPHNYHDTVTLPEGFTSHVILKYGDAINSRGETFGEDADYLAFILENEEQGWLWVNHENSWWLTGEDLLKGVGGSCIRLKKNAATGFWRPIVPSDENFRVNGLDTRIKLLGPAAGSAEMGGATEVLGSLANCGGGISPWGTFFSAEENYYEFTGDTDNPSAFDVPKHELPETLRRPERHYGWMMEIDPQTREVFKHTALGRFGHENIAFGYSKDGRLVAYMGDDRIGMHLYKYISRGKYDAAAGKANRALLSDGVLHVADTVNGRWIPLDPELTPELAKRGMSLADICVRTRVAASFAGATALARPEDVEIHPQTGEVYVCLTTWHDGQDEVGAILALREAGDDHGALTFEHKILSQGAQDNGFTWPDNIAFGPQNSLMVTTDYKVDKPEPLPGTPWEKYGNNGLYLVPTSGPRRGQVSRFATGPLGAELCSPTLSPGRDELWVNVQHPGEGGVGHWPTGGEAKPVSGLVVIRRA